MASSTLLERDIRGGRELVHELDRRGLDLRAALWLFSGDNNRWRLILALPDVEQPGGLLRAYGDIVSAIKSLPADIRIGLDDSTVLHPSDELIRAVAKLVVTGAGAGEARLTGHAVNGVFIEDAYVYRVDRSRASTAAVVP